ncbi:MAG TPA: 30S ribosome-binding factor RbfA [Thermoanaerobaculia bacterium]|jgi:ribosome-binding factor A|nr:30S ribosome-binding factor RbfA [Thermoanaerobaculia bacterium]
MSRRTDRIGDQLRAELADLLLREMKDPRVRLATVLNVDVTGDLRHAAVHVSVLGEEAERLATIEALQHARGFLRSEIARRLRHLRVSPELNFKLDRGAEHSQNISNLLETLHVNDDESA